MKIKKKNKKKFKRKKLQMTNLNFDNTDEFEDREIIEEKRAEKKTLEKGKISQKSQLNLKKGRILEISSNYRCRVKIESSETICSLSGRLKQINFETRNIISVGDFVNVDISDEPRIEEILSRKNILSRFSEDSFQTQIILASNVSQVVITSSIKEPVLNLGLIDRFLCSTTINEINPIICINKIDLATNLSELEEELLFYRKNNFEVILTSAVEKIGISEMKNILKNNDTAFVGHSGTGKSSLLNCIQPNLNLQVAKISETSQKGTHTTSSAKLIEWDFGGYLVDTPGIKTFGLHREDSIKLPRIFPGFSSLVDKCKFNNCTHTHEIGCAVKVAVENGNFAEARYESYLRILESLNRKSE